MNKLVKILASALGVLILIVAVGMFYITSVMDPNDYKPRIEQLALEQAGIKLNIEGDISWSLYPWLGMETGSIRISYPEQPELARLDSAQVSLQLIPLLSGRIEMSDVILTGLSVSLIKDTEGNVNWSNEKVSSIEPQPSVQAPEEGRGVQSLPELDIASINIRNGRLEYTDKLHNSRIELSDIDLTTGRVLLGDSLPLNLAFNLRQFDGTLANLEARTRLSTELHLSSDLENIRLSDFNITSQLSGQQLPPSLPELALKTQLAIDLTDERIVAEALTLSLGPVSASGTWQFSDFSAPKLLGDVTIVPFNLKSLMAELGQALPELKHHDALTALGLNTQFEGDLQALQFNPLSINLDDAALTGHANLSVDSGHIALTLKGDSLDADRYMPAGDSNSGASSANSQNSSGWPSDDILPLEALRELNLSVALDLDQLTIMERTLTQPSLALSATDGILNLEHLRTQIYSGKVHASGSIDARNSPAKSQLTAQINTIQLGQVLQELAETDLFSGLFSANLDLTTSGQSIEAMINSLNGQAKIEMKEGVLQGIDMAQTVCQGIQTVTALGINPQQVDRSTPFADLSGNFTLRNGRVSNNDLTAMLDAMRLRAQGEINLPEKSLDYRLGFTIMENLFQQTCSVNNRLEGLELPILCAGKFDTPPAQMCRPDTSVFTQLLRREVRREVQRQVEERIGGSVEEQIRERIGGEEGARDLIRGLLR